MLIELFLFTAGTLLTCCGALSVIILNGIKSEIRDIKISFISLEEDMRDGLAEIEQRVIILETKYSTRQNNHLQ